MSIYQLHYDNVTEKKFIWIKNLSGVDFKLYIPKKLFPDPHPPWILVSIDTDPPGASPGFTPKLRAVVEFKKECTETVHYAPVGDQEFWQIGEPYIPKAVLGRPWPPRLRIGVFWE